MLYNSREEKCMKTIVRRKERKNQQLAAELSKEVNLSPVVTEFLCDKGYTTKESIFLTKKIFQLIKRRLRND